MTDAADGATEQSLAYDYELDAPPEKVWRALTVPAFRDHWLQPAPAGAVAEVVEAVPPSRLKWSWREADAPADLVTFTLRPSRTGGTLLRLVHERGAGRASTPVAANSNGPLAMAA